MIEFVYLIAVFVFGIVIWGIVVELRKKTDKEETSEIKNERFHESQRGKLPKSNLQDRSKILTKSTPTLPKTMPKKEPKPESIPEKTKKLEQEPSEKPEDVQSELTNQKSPYLKEIQNLLEKIKITKQELSDYRPPKRKTTKSSKNKEKSTHKIKK